MKNVWLKSETGKLLELVRLKLIEKNKDTRITDDLAIRIALDAYIHDRR